MNKRFLYRGLAFLVAVILVAFGYPRFESFRHRLLDQDRMSGCMANMGYVKKHLLEVAGRLSPETPIATAIESLIQSGQIDSARLTCACSGKQFRFRGQAGWLQNRAGEHAREIVAFEPVSSHHPEVPVLVLYASGDSDLIQQDELQNRLVDAAAESAEPTSLRRDEGQDS